MKKLVAVCCCLFVVAAFAEDAAPAWKARHVSARPDKKGVDAMYKAMKGKK